MKSNLLTFCRRALPLALVLLSGCASMLGLKPPEVSLSDVQLTGGTLLEQRFKLQLRVLNPNDNDLTIDGLTFRLDVAGKQFARGVSNQSVVLPRLADTIVEVDASTQVLSLIQQIPKLVDSNGKVPYRMQGDVVTREYGRIPFDHSGETDLPWTEDADKKSSGSRTF